MGNSPLQLGPPVISSPLGHQQEQALKVKNIRTNSSFIVSKSVFICVRLSCLLLVISFRDHHCTNAVECCLGAFCIHASFHEPSGPNFVALSEAKYTNTKTYENKLYTNVNFSVTLFQIRTTPLFILFPFYWLHPFNFARPIAGLNTP